MSDLPSKKMISFVADKVRHAHHILGTAKEELPRLRDLQEFSQSQVLFSTPTYCPFEKGAPNFLKFNQYNPKSIVDGYFYQFNFFPWNIESHSVFRCLREQINLLLSLSSHSYFQQTKNNYDIKIGLSKSCLYNDKFFVRICYQYFPKDVGYLAIHRDPVGLHQIVPPLST